MGLEALCFRPVCLSGCAQCLAHTITHTQYVCMPAQRYSPTDLPLTFSFVINRSSLQFMSTVLCIFASVLALSLLVMSAMLLLEHGWGSRSKCYCGTNLHQESVLCMCVLMSVPGTWSIWLVPDSCFRRLCPFTLDEGAVSHFVPWSGLICSCSWLVIVWHCNVLRQYPSLFCTVCCALVLDNL